MVQRFEDLDFAEGGDGHAFLLVVHQDTFERNELFRRLVHSLVDLTEPQSIGYEKSLKTIG